MKKAIEEILRQFELIKLERDEEIRQYKEIIQNTPLEERKKRGLAWYPVTIDKEEFGIGANLSLELSRTTQHDIPHKFSNGQTASLYLNNKEKPSVNGIIAKAKDNKLVLVLNIDELPDWIEDGKLGLDLLYNEGTYKEMERALRRVATAEKDRLAELRNVILGYAKPNVDSYEFSSDFPELNDSQNRAIQKIVLSKDVAVVHGPPGTGKTTTIVKAIEVSIKNKRRVLACAPSNTAVDLLTSKLAAKGISVVRLGHPARVNESLQKNTLDAKLQAQPDFKRLKLLRREAITQQEKAAKFKRSFGPVEREARRDARKLARELRFEARELEKYLLKKVITDTQVVTSTMAGAGSFVLKDSLFETVFLDEAGQALEPACWIPITRAMKVVFAGDHQQLPPTVKSKEAMKKGLGETLFEKCINRTDASVMLETQYRMHEHIMGFSNQQFYNGKLQAHESVKDQVLGDSESDQLLKTAVEFVDTSGCAFEEKVNEQTLSTGNPLEADLLFKHLTLLLNLYKSHNQQKVDPKLSIGIIAPYREQVRQLRKSLKEHPDLLEWEDNMSIHTVDGFQGQERDIIYISMVRSNDEGKIGFLSDFRRINVALTRAKKKLVVVGDSATIGNHKFYQQFLDYIESVNAYQSAWSYLY